MRISDWSSDVCSSDLSYNNGVPAKTGMTKLGERPGPDASGAHNPALSPYAASASRSRDRPWRAVATYGPRPDRKSVVSGKSVSVRVDLGGRSIIKKKTIKSQQITQSKDT